MEALETSRTSADEHRDKIRALKLSNDLIIAFDPQFFHENIAPVVHMNLLATHARFHSSLRLIQYTLGKNRSVEAFSYLKREDILLLAKRIYERNKENFLVVFGYADIFSHLGKNKEALNMMRDITELRAGKTVEEKRTAAIMKVFYLGALLDTGNLVKAKNVIQEFKYDSEAYRAEYDADIRLLIDFIEIGLRYLEKDFENILPVFSSGHFDEAPCLLFRISGKMATNSWEKENISPLKVLKIRSAINEVFTSLEAKGLSNRMFFDLWAGLLTDLERYDEAATKFERSLDFRGDHVWSLLNWGRS